MSAFKKRKTSREVHILGQKYLVDFGRDAIAFILRRVQEALEEIEQKDSGDFGQAERFIEMVNEERATLKRAIGEILDCPDAVQVIFQDEDTVVLHRDIYTFLVEEYIDVMKTKSPYDVERIEGL